MTHRTPRPAACEPGCMEGRTKEMAERLRLSRERLMASELDSTTRAWRLWAACVDATVGYTREADRTYAATLARAANVKRQVASHLLLRFGDLGIFEWEPARQGSRDARILALPALEPSRPQSGATKSSPALSRPQSGAAKGDDHGPRVGPLHSNTPMRHGHGYVEVPEWLGGHEDGEPGLARQEDGPPTRDTPPEELTREELDRAAYRAFQSGDEARLEVLRNELHRRTASRSALARFGES